MSIQLICIYTGLTELFLNAELRTVITELSALCQNALLGKCEWLKV